MNLRIDSSPFNVKPGDAGLFCSLCFMKYAGRLFEGWFWGTSGNTFIKSFSNFDCDPTKTHSKIVSIGRFPV